MTAKGWVVPLGTGAGMEEELLMLLTMAVAICVSELG